MEAFQPDWKKESENFQKEEFYESIRAPKWIDFCAPDRPEPDDNAWFCLQAGCDQKHGTVVDQTTTHSTFLLKFKAFKTTNQSSPKVDRKTRMKPRTPLSAPRLQSRDKTLAKAKTLPMSTGKIRNKQCLENEDPNPRSNNNMTRPEVAIEDVKGFSTPKRLSDADDMDTSQDSPPHVFTAKLMDEVPAVYSTPEDGKNQNIKFSGFSTPRVKSCLVKPEPFRSIPSSKGLVTQYSKATRSKGTAVKSLSFQTPSKVMSKAPSKYLTPLTKICDHMKNLSTGGGINYIPGHFCRSSRCAANDPNYSSPASVPSKKFLVTRHLQAGDTPLSRSRSHKSRDLHPPSSSKMKDSKCVSREPPSSHRKALFYEEVEKENMPDTNAQTLELVQGKGGSCGKDDRDGNEARNFSEKTYQENEPFQIPEIDASLTRKCEQDLQSGHVSLDVECNNNELNHVSHAALDVECNRNEPNHGTTVEEKNMYINVLSDMEADGESRKNSIIGGYLSISCECNDTKGKKYIESENDEIEINLAVIGGERLAYEVDGMNRCKESENSDAERLISEKDVKVRANLNLFATMQECSETFPEQVETNVESGFDAEPENRNPEEKADEFLMDFDAENRGSVEEVNEIQNVADAEPQNSRVAAEEANEVQNDCDVDSENRRAAAEEMNEVQTECDIGSEIRRAARDEANEVQTECDVESEKRRAAAEEANEAQHECDEESEIRRAVAEEANDVQNECDEVSEIRRAAAEEVNEVQNECDKESENRDVEEEEANEVQNEYDAEPENKDLDEESNEVQLGSDVDSGSQASIEYWDVESERPSHFTKNVTDQKFIENQGDLFEEIRRDESGTEWDNSCFLQLNGRANDYQYLDQDLNDQGKASLDSGAECEVSLGKNSADFISEAGQEIHKESIDLACDINNSESGPEILKDDHPTQSQDNGKIKSIGKDCEHGLEATEDQANEGQHCPESNGLSSEVFHSGSGPDCNEKPCFPQPVSREESEFYVEHCLHDSETSECHEEPHCHVLESSNSEADSDSGAECIDDALTPEAVTMIKSDVEACLRHLESAEENQNGAKPSDLSRPYEGKVIQGVDCILNIISNTTGDGKSATELDSAICTAMTDPRRTARHEEKSSESEEISNLSTSTKAKKRRSSDMNSQTNCSKGELCQDESCKPSSKLCFRSLAAHILEVNGPSVLHGGKHKKIKSTCPKPFRLRTEERGVLKEAILYKKTEQFVAGKESVPIFSVCSISTNKSRHKEKHLQTEASKLGKTKLESAEKIKSSKPDNAKFYKAKHVQPESSKNVKPKPLENKEDMKNASDQTAHHASKMPFFGQPFKPQRSTKKLTVPKEPNFHPIHPKKDCTKAWKDMTAKKV
eukprot:Gb_40431 [translate_table: standard]